MILKIYETLWTMLLGFETPLDSGERLPISSYGLSVAWGFEIPFFLTTILQIPIYTKVVFSRDIFYNLKNFNLYYVSLKFEFILKVYNSQKFILKVSLQETPSIILQNPLYTKSIFSRDIFYNFHTLFTILILK